jgi:hypothetical protein
MAKKISLFLAMGALLALSANRMSAQTIIAQGTAGSLTWVLTSDSVMTINGSGAMPDYSDPNYLPWYANRTQIKSALIGNSITTIGDCAFYSCISLTSVTIPNSVTTIGNSAFYDCVSLTLVTIPNSVTTIGNRAFINCRGLTAIDVVADNLNYSSANGVLFNKNQTTIIQCPGEKSGTYSIPNSVASVGYGAFSGCVSLISVTIPNSVTSIGNMAFYDCTSLTSVTIPNSVTSIGSGAFYYCSGLASVTIPNSVATIGIGAFVGCSRLIDITNLNPTPIAIDANVFDSVDRSTCVLKVPAGFLAAYRAANVWKDFLNIQEISVAIADVQHTALLQIYPNPVTNGQFTLSNGQGKADIYTIQGVRVGSYSLTDKETTINISHLTDGVYFMKVGNTTRKLIINK